MARVVEAREQAAPRRPLLVKIAPDLDLRGLDDVVEVCARRGVDGLIVANTTVARPASLEGRDRGEAGGLSGRPLFESSTRMLARAYLRCGGALTLIGAAASTAPRRRWPRSRRARRWCRSTPASSIAARR